MGGFTGIHFHLFIYFIVLVYYNYYYYWEKQFVRVIYLFRKSRKSWKMFWYVLKDHVLYVYKASEDVLALETIPVLGYEVERAKVNFLI